MIPRFRAYFKYKNRPGVMAAVTDLNFRYDMVKVKYNEGIFLCSSKYLPIQGGDSVDVHLMQSTGLKDKNGKEIFDGDILERDLTGDLDYGRGKVYWDLLLLTWVVKDAGDSSDDLLCEESIDEIEIIGNIYENPELLET